MTLNRPARSGEGPLHSRGRQRSHRDSPNILETHDSRYSQGHSRTSLGNVTSPWVSNSGRPPAAQCRPVPSGSSPSCLGQHPPASRLESARILPTCLTPVPRARTSCPSQLQNPPPPCHHDKAPYRWICPLRATVDMG